MAEIPEQDPLFRKDQREHLKISFLQFFRDLKKFVINLFNVQEDIDHPGAIESIKKDVEFKGFNVWILISSIIICSVGLNLNSTAVIIGAMLISPLMGPITGIGFAVATFDHALWVKSLKNYINTVVVSIVTSYVFFVIAPEGSNSSELMSRTTPTLLDLLVAVFGGLAGILASTRRIKTNVIPGVAIATALMPPLCTAGYGLATMQMNFFLGAIYLFFINSVFISVAAMVVVRYLKFRPVSYVNPRVKKKARLIILVSVAFISVPSVILYFKVMKKSVYEQRAMNFVRNEIMDDKHWFSEPIILQGDTENVIRLYVYGKEITNEEKSVLNERMLSYKLKNTRLVLENMGETDMDKIHEGIAAGEIVRGKEVPEDFKLQLAGQNKLITELKDSIAFLHLKNVDLPALMEEISVQYECIETVEYGPIKKLKDQKEVEVPTFFIVWNDNCSIKQQEETLNKLQAWLKVKYKKQLQDLEIEELAAKR